MHCHNFISEKGHDEVISGTVKQVNMASYNMLQVCKLILIANSCL